MIDHLSSVEAKQLLKEIAARQPAVILDVAAMLSARQPVEDQPGPSSDQPSWCVCSHCPMMDRDQDRICCGMAPQYCDSQRPVCCCCCCRILPNFHVHFTVCQVDGIYMSHIYIYIYIYICNTSIKMSQLNIKSGEKLTGLV